MTARCGKIGRIASAQWKRRDFQSRRRRRAAMRLAADEAHNGAYALHSGAPDSVEISVCHRAECRRAEIIYKSTTRHGRECMVTHLRRMTGHMPQGGMQDGMYKHEVTALASRTGNGNDKIFSAGEGDLVRAQ